MVGLAETVGQMAGIDVFQFAADQAFGGADGVGRVGSLALQGRQRAWPLFTLATRLLVVPKSMPTARRCWCGAAERPGSAICRSAMVVSVCFRCGNKRLF